MDLDLGRAARGSRVELFVLRPEHVTDAYVAWLNDPEVNQYLEIRFAAQTLESTRAYVQHMLASPDNLFLGIRSLELDRHVGNIKLGPINRLHGTSEIGIIVGDKAAWGRGIATEAIALLSRIAGESLGLRKVTAGCYESNGGSKRAFEKAGFETEALRKAQVLVNGTPEGIYLMGRILP